MNGYVLDSGVLIRLAKDSSNAVRDSLEKLQHTGVRLVTIKEVCQECRTVPVKVLSDLHILVEPTQTPAGDLKQIRMLDAFQAGPGLTRADRAVVGHAIAERLDIMTTDWNMKQRSFKEFLKRLDRLPDSRLPLWYIPTIEVLEGGRSH